MMSGPGCTPWMIIAAISTAAGAEPGTASASTGMIAPGTQALSPVSAAIRPSTEPLPNWSRSLLARLAAAYEDHDATSSPTPGTMPMNVPITPERRIVRQYFRTSPGRGRCEPNSRIFARAVFSARIVSTSAKPNAPDERRDQLEAAGEVAIAEREPLVGVDRVLADRRQREPEEADEPALQRVVAGEVARDDDAEEREPEELERAELERHLAERRRGEREEEHADQRAEHRAGGGDADRATRPRRVARARSRRGRRRRSPACRGC